MKTFISCINFFFLLALLALLSAAVGLSAADPSSSSWKHFQGVGWNSTAVENLRYAQGAGYEYVFHTHQDLNLALDTEAVEVHKQGLGFLF